MSTLVWRLFWEVQLAFGGRNTLIEATSHAFVYALSSAQEAVFCLLSSKAHC